MQIDCLSKMNNSDYRTAGNNCGGLEPQAVPLSCILLPSQSSHLHLCNETLGFFSMKANFYTSEHTRPPHNGSAFCSLRINWCLLNKVVSSAVGELWWIERFGEQQGLQVVLTSAVVQRKLLLITDWIELSGAEEWHWCSLTIHDNVLLLSTTTSATSTFPGLWITLNRILVNFACLCFKRKKLFN